MVKIKNIIWIPIGIIFTSLGFANNAQPIACKDLHDLEIKPKIQTFDKKFQWNNSNCQIVGTKSVFLKKDKNGVIHFEKGLQLFIYQNKQLKFICLPGWVCKPW